MSIKERFQKAVFVILLAALSVFSAVFGAAMSTEEVPAAALISNFDEAAAAIRGGMSRNSSCLTVRFTSKRDISSRLLELADALMKSAVEVTDAPNEGDYIRYQCGGYESSYTVEETDGVFSYSLKLTPKYYSYLEYEQAVTEKVSEIISGFGFDENTSDYEKICAIYDYVCGNVEYDRIHEKNPYYCMRSTAYAALIWGKATCQGYCTALYRLLKEVGVNVRIITGTADGTEEGVLHAWNIIELDGVYYCADATWDAGKDEYEWLLKGSADFAGHTPEEEFASGEFAENCPISESSYID